MPVLKKAGCSGRQKRNGIPLARKFQRRLPVHKAAGCRTQKRVWQSISGSPVRCKATRDPRRGSTRTSRSLSMSRSVCGTAERYAVRVSWLHAQKTAAWRDLLHEPHAASPTPSNALGARTSLYLALSVFFGTPISSTGTAFALFRRRGDQTGCFPPLARSPVRVMPIAAITLLLGTSLERKLRRLRRQPLAAVMSSDDFAGLAPPHD